MIRFFVLPFFIVFSFIVTGQLPSNGVISNDNQTESFWNEPDCFPLKKNGGWVWYDISNDSISNKHFFTDYVHPKNGYCENFVLKNDSMWGMMSGYDVESLPFIYDSVIFINEFTFTQTDDVWSYHQTRIDGPDTLISIELDSLYDHNGTTYFYAKGKTGMILRDEGVIPAKYDAIHAFDCNYDAYNNWRYLMTLTGKEFNLLDPQGKEVLPKNVWDLRCTEDNIFEFRRGVHPEYYSPYSNEIISPDGRDIIFYNGRNYKIYSEDKSTSELHLIDGTILKDTYDDYFILSDNFIAVRKNGKVGLTIGGKELRSAIKYDQINVLSESLDENGKLSIDFRFFHGDSCGLMTQFGVEKIGAKYANILPTNDPDRFIVLDNNLGGIVNRNGKIIIPVKYDYISYDELTSLFTLQLNNKFGLSRKDGSELIPIEYTKHNTLSSSGIGNAYPLHVLGKGNKLFFANYKGFIEKKGFDHYDYTGAVLKTYDSKEITVYALSKMGLVEEKQSYPVYNPTLISKDYYSKWTGLNVWDESYLEENQKAGYFGLRLYAKRGFGVQPTYRTVRPTSFFSYLGEVEYESNDIKWLGEIPMTIIRSYDELKIGSGRIENYPLFNTETILPFPGTDDRRLNYELDRAQVFTNDTDTPFSERELLETIHYGDCAGRAQYVRRFFKGGTPEICPIESAELSLYEYYQYWNMLDAVRLTPEIMKLVLDPKIGVRFDQTNQVVVNTFDYDRYDDALDFEIPVNYEKFEFISYDVFFEKMHDSKTGKLRKFFLNDEDKEEFVDDLLSAKAVSGGYSGLMLTEVPVSRMAKIHVDYPNYFFYQDSVDLSYVAGRITRRIDSNFVQLVSPNGEVLADSCILIRYLNVGRFAVLREKGWELIDKNGVSLRDLKFISVTEFSNDRAEFGFADGSVILLNSNGEEVMSLPESRTFLDDDYYIFGSNPTQIINRFSNQKDEALNGEKYKSKGFFVSKRDGKTNIRRFGDPSTIELKSRPTLKSFGSFLHYKKGKHLFSIDSNLVSNKHKKVNKFRMVTAEIGWLEGKRDVLVDSDCNTIHTLGKEERFELRNGNLVILEGDSVMIKFGSFTKKKQDTLIEKLPEVKVISENGKYGVQQGEEMILSMNYSWLSKINDQEFLTKIEKEQHLYNSSLDRIGNRPFDFFIQTTGGNFVFFYNDQVFVVSMDRRTQRFIN